MGIVIATAGVALAIIVMECTLAISFGFKQGITSRILGFEGQLWVEPAYDYESSTQEEFIELTPNLVSIVSESLPEASISLKFTLPGILKTENDFAGIYFSSFDNSHDFTFENNAVLEGDFSPITADSISDKIAISKTVSNQLGLKVGDKAFSYFFINDGIKSRKFTISAIYDTGFSDYDQTVAYISMPALQSICAYTPEMGSQLLVTNPGDADIAANAAMLQQRLIYEYNTGRIEKLYPVNNVTHTGAAFFSWLDLLDTNVIVIFILMACVSGFTLIAGMFILILDRIPSIGLLRTMGASKGQIRLICINLAMKTVGIGIMIGNAVGLSLLMAQKRYACIKLDPETYYLSSVPVDINWHAIVLLNLCVVAAAWAMLYIPSRIAAGISPASTMRFE